VWRGGGIFVVAVAGLLAAPAVRADPQDTVRLVQEGSRAFVDAALEPRLGPDCAELNLGVAGAAGGRETEEQQLIRALPDRGNGLSPGDRTGAPASLPERVAFKRPTETFNRRYVFAARDGRLYFKSNAERTGIEQPWKRLALPACFEGDVRQIALDDDELVALDGERRVYTMDGALADPLLFTWTRRWGAPFWQGAGWRLPPSARRWAWSVLSFPEDRTYRDSADNDFPVGEAKVSHLWSLGDGGRRMTFNDPWLPRDSSYEMCGPHRGRFRAVSIAASGSTVFVVGRSGDLFTRQYDFDLSGHNPLFERYSYDDQRGREDPAIQLPPPAWIEQPKVPGAITDVITIEKDGPGTIHRTLRVEGRDAAGTHGLWQKDITERAWRFVATGARQLGRRLRNPRRDTSATGLARAEDARYTRSGDGWRGALADFNPHCSPARLEVRLDGAAPFALRLHAIDSIRQQPRSRDLDDRPLHLSGAVEVPAALLADLPRRDAATRGFVARHLQGRRFTPVDVDATRDAIVVRQLGWRFERARRGG
jgi:hypothetical protein